MEGGIFGLEPWAFFMGLIIVLGGLLVYMRLSKLSKNRKKVDGCLICDFYDLGTGAVDSFLCPTINYEVHPPKEFYKKFGKDAKAIGIQAPEGHELENELYFTVNGAIYDTYYPFNKNKWEQVRVGKTAFFKNLPFPIVFYDEEKYTPAYIEEMTARLVATSKDEATAKALEAQDNAWWNNLEAFGQYLKRIPLIMIIAAVGALLAGAAAYMGYQVLQKVSGG